MVLVGGVAHVIHRQRGLALSDSETDPFSPTKRVMRSYVAAVSFISVLIVLISAMVLGYLIFQLVAPASSGPPDHVSTRCRRSSIRSTLVGATAFVFFAHQALAPAALRLCRRGSSMPSATANVED